MPADKPQQPLPSGPHGAALWQSWPLTRAQQPRARIGQTLRQLGQAIALAVASQAAAQAEPVINEIVVSTTGTDREFLELIGAPRGSLDGVTLLEVESGGTIDKVIELTGNTLGDNGYLLLASPEAAGVLGVTGNLAIPNNSFTNKSQTYLLVEGFAGTSGDDIDSDDDGIAENTPWTAVLDSLAVIDDDSPVVYSRNVLGPDGTFLAAGGYRDPQETGSFVLHDFFNTALYTPTPGTFAPEEPNDHFIHEIQGPTNLSDMALTGGSNGADVSPLRGEVVRVQAVVTAVLQGEAALGGFYVQEEEGDADNDPSTSEGVFVASDVTVALGDLVTVEGTVTEVEGETRLDAAQVLLDASANPLPSAVDITLPTDTVLVDTDGDFVANLEAYEGMRVRIAQPMAVTELFQLDRFGTIRISAEGRLEQFTQNNPPSASGFVEHRKAVAARSLVIDDGQDVQNPNPVLVPGLGADGILDGNDVLRMGDKYTELVGVLSYSEDQQSSSEEPEYRIHAPLATLEQENHRPAAIDPVGGSLKVASFNVLNFFTTLDTWPGDEQVGPNGLAPRGADTNPQAAVPGVGETAEYDRQLAKLAAALAAIDADVVGLTELENDFVTGGTRPVPQDAQAPRAVAIEELVDTLNAWAAEPVYDWVRPAGEFVGGDAIAVGLIYKTNTVVPLGAPAVLEHFAGQSFLDPNNTGQGRNRAALAQSFSDVRKGEVFTVVVNHFKSKGDSGLSGDPAENPDLDQGDGQGFWNDTRTQAARILLDWLASDPTGSFDSDFLVLGDLNAYPQEDPIQTLIAGADGIPGTDDDYTDLARRFVTEPYSFVFDGQRGTLDYAVASPSLNDQVTGATEWHINADEPDAFDYNLEFGREPALYTGNAYRASDHDPLIIGLELGTADSAPRCQGRQATIYVGADGRVIGGRQDGRSYRGLLLGSRGDDVIVGTAEGDTIAALTGDDLVCAGGGNDRVLGGFGDDQVFGEAGNDRMIGGFGRGDQADGGPGIDTCLGFAERNGCERP